MKNTLQNTAARQRKETRLSYPSVTADALVAEMRPSLPLYIMRPDQIAANANRFLSQFPGTTMYAVKCNPDKTALQAMIRAGIKAFDCASIEEVRLIRKLAPKAKIYFMHPIKAREAIRESYHEHGVRAFVLDCVDELYKILQETDLAPDLELFVRVAIPKGAGSVISLAGKFGASVEDTADLLQRCRPVSVKLGVSFHVGSQCMKPERYAMAIRLAAQAIRASGVTVESLDVGGGFPVEYPTLTPPPFEHYMEAIRHSIARQKLGHLELLCEPGRAMVATSGTLVVRVEQRKGGDLHINDGTYSCMFEAGSSSNMALPARMIRPDQPANQAQAALKPFRFFGPTCDSLDMMAGPYYLPEDIHEGDWIEIGQTGAYGLSSQSRFNGFGKAVTVIVGKPENTGPVLVHSSDKR
jgi:ornithine decarboxylase